MAIVAILNFKEDCNYEEIYKWQKIVADSINTGGAFPVKSNLFRLTIFDNKWHVLYESEHDKR